MDNVIFSQGNNEENAEEASASGQGNQFAYVFLRIGEKFETVHGWDGRDEEDTE